MNIDYDGYNNFLLNQKTLLVFRSFSMPLFLLFIMPIYEFSKSRIPMLLLFSKTIGLTSALFVAIVDAFISAFPIFHPNWWNYVLYVNNVPYFAVRIHLLAMALNRFYSVYFPFKYQKMNKKMILQKICCALWMAALILTPPSIYVGMNQIKIFPWTLFLRSNFEQICIYSTLLFYGLMAVKLIWMKWHLLPELQSNNVLERDYYKISAVCIVSILPFLLSILSLTLMQIFIVAGIYQKNYLLQDILITFNIPFLQVANFSEEICLLILSADFRALFIANLIRIVACFLKAITFGKYTIETTNLRNNENDPVDNNTTNNGTNTISNNVVVYKCPILKIRRNNRVGVAPVN